MARWEIDEGIKIFDEMGGTRQEWRLTEISSLFFEQRIVDLKCEKNTVCEDHRLQMIQKSLPKHESDGRDAIERGFSESVPELTAAIITESTRCLSQKDEKAAALQVHQEELDRLAQELLHEAGETEVRLETDIANLNRENTIQRSQMEALKKERTADTEQHQKDVKKLREAKDKAQRQMQDKIVQFDKEMAKIKNEHQAKQGRFEMKNKDLSQKCVRLQKEVEALNGKLKENQKSFNEQLGGLQSEREVVHRQLKDAEAVKETLEKSKATLEEEISQSQARVLALREEFDNSNTAWEKKEKGHKKRESELHSEILESTSRQKIEREANGEYEHCQLIQRQQAMQLEEVRYRNHAQKDMTASQRSLHEHLESAARQITERDADTVYEQLLTRNEEHQTRQRLADTMESEAALIMERAEREIRQIEEREALQRELDRQQQEAFQSKEKHRLKESKTDYWIMMTLLIGGGALAVIGFIIFMLARKSYNEMSDNMISELNEQREIMKQPHPLVPEYPSAHANRLGVHEHPEVRDVFGMKEPWDVTPGEGFHVARITRGGGTPGTTRGGTDEGVDVIIEIPDQSEDDAGSVHSVMEKDRVSVVVENEGETANEAVEHVRVIEGYENLDI